MYAIESAQHHHPAQRKRREAHEHGDAALGGGRPAPVISTSRPRTDAGGRASIILDRRCSKVAAVLNVAAAASGLALASGVLC